MAASQKGKIDALHHQQRAERRANRPADIEYGIAGEKIRVLLSSR